MKSFNLDTTVTVCGGTPQEPINVSNSNDTYVVDTLVDLELPDITVTDSDGTVASVPSMENVVCTPSAPTSVRVSNSDDTYDVNTSVDLELPDSSVSNSNNSYVNALPATEDLALPNINFTDSDGVTTSVPSMEDIVAASCPAKSGIAYQPIILTGQLTSYFLYDDAWHLANGTYNYTPPTEPLSYSRLDMSSIDPFFTLVDNNSFGNKNRFTDVNGLQVYPTNYVIDHLTRLGWLNDFTKTAILQTALSNAAAATDHSFSDWRVPNINEIESITRYKSNLESFEYPPFSKRFNSDQHIWTSTRRIKNPSTIGQTFRPFFGISSAFAITASKIYLTCRNHFEGIAPTAEEVLADGNTVLWVDSEENVTKNGANKVSVWGDKSGQGNDLLQATGASQPLYSTNGILFDGANDFMKAIPFTLVQPEMVYIVFKQVTWSYTTRVFDGGSTNAMVLSQRPTSPDLNIQVGGYSSSLSLDNTNLSVNTFGIARCLYDGVNSKFIIDDTTPVTGSVSTLSAGGFSLGARGSNALHSNIEVKEVIIRKVADSAEDEALIYQYLSNKYGI